MITLTYVIEVNGDDASCSLCETESGTSNRKETIISALIRYQANKVLGELDKLSRKDILTARIAELEERIEALHRSEYEQATRLEQRVAEICKPFAIENETLKKRISELEIELADANEEKLKMRSAMQALAARKQND